MMGRLNRDRAHEIERRANSFTVHNKRLDALVTLEKVIQLSRPKFTLKANFKFEN